MGCINIQFSNTFTHPRLNFSNNETKTRYKKQQIVCGLRNEGPRKPMWRKSFLSIETIQTVQTLKLAKNSFDKLENVFKNRVFRLLKADLLDTLSELQRQNELELAQKVFEFVRNEVWYEPDASLFCDMILMFGKNRLIENAEQIFVELKNEGLEPDTRVYAEMIGAYFKVDMLDKAMKMYELMMSSACVPDKLTITILIRNLEKCGEQELVARIKKECTDYLDSPRKFFEEVERKQQSGKARSLA